MEYQNHFDKSQSFLVIISATFLKNDRKTAEKSQAKKCELTPGSLLLRSVF